MKSSESCWVWFCDEPEALIVSTWVASWPVRWTCRPLGMPLPVKVDADRVDHALRLRAAAEGDDVGLDERLARLAVARDAEVDQP